MVINEEYFVMQDGVKLYTRIILPSAEGKFPVVFMRNPYEDGYSVQDCENNLFLKNGYAIIVQHPRGHGHSEGFCRPYHERDDSLATLDIIRQKNFYSGEIFLMGESYLATSHLCYLDTNPADIKGAALSIQTDRMYFRNYRNGCCYDFCNQGWWLYMIRREYPEIMPFKEAQTRPYYKSMERAVGVDVPEFTQNLLNDTYNEFWKSAENTEAITNLKIPVLLSEGWYDFYIEGMYSMWERMPNEIKKKSALVIGPWGHATKVSENAEYPLENGNLPDEYVVNYFNSIRNGTDYTDIELGKVNYYSVGGGFWTKDDRDFAKRKLYFSADGRLAENPGRVGSVSYIFNPDEKPEFFRHHDIFQAGKPVDGVVSFVSEPFLEDANFYGKIRWRMKVKTDCDDTAFFIRVYLVEDGEAYNLTQTITSLSNINQEYKSGEECLIDIFTPYMGFTIKKGNCIRVDISSHSDLYVPHSNVKGHWALVEECRIAENTLIIDEDSYIELSKTEM